MVKADKSPSVPAQADTKPRSSSERLVISGELALAEPNVRPMASPLDDLDDAPPGRPPGDDLDDREPCPDGRCTGVLGADGRCGECRRTADEAARAEAETLPPGRAAPALETSGDDGGDLPDLDDRRLCSDGACIGVIGEDGRCRECGRSA